MNDTDKTKEQLIEELDEMRQRVTKLATVEEALRENEGFTQSILNTAPSHIYIYDFEERRNIYSNDGLRLVIGYSPEEVQGLGSDILSNLIHPDDETKLAHIIQELVNAKDNEVKEGEYRFRHKNGEWVWVLSRISVYKRTADGQVLQILGSSIDITERKQMEEALRESKMRATNLLNAIPDSVFRLSQDGTYLDYKAKQEELYDQSGSSLIGKNIADNSPPEFAHIVLQYINTTLDTEEMQVFEFQLPVPLGMRDYEARMIMSGKDEVTATVRDITERKQAKEQLSYQANLLQNVSDAIVSTDMDLNIKTWNQAAERIYGWREDEVIGQNIDVIHQTEFLDIQQEEAQKQLLAKGFWQGMVRQKRKNGDALYIMASVSLLKDDDGNPIGGVTVHHDITERKQAEEALLEKQIQLQAILDYSPILISIKDLEGNAVLVNRNFEVLEGPDPEEFIGKNVYDLFPEDIADVLWQNDLAALEAGGPIEAEEIVAHKDGTLHTYLTVKFPLYGDTKQAFGTCAISIDITDHKQAEKKHLELTMEQERIQILTNFITQASHEFKTPLSTINTSVYFLDKLADSDKQDQHIRKIKDQVENITTLVDALTLMAKLDSGGHDIILKEVNLNDTVRAICNRQQPAFQEKNINIVLELSEKQLLLQGDIDYLEQAIQHIINNAVDYTPKGGAIVIHVDSNDSNTIIKITDTGVGINEDDLPHIFDRFYRSDKVGTTRGFGLGLPIAKAIIELHQGCIEVKSEVGKGSIFRILLPVT